MNRFIFKLFFKRLTNPKTKLLHSSISYYSIISLIPTISFINIILANFNFKFYYKYSNIFTHINTNKFSNLLVSIITIYMISRIFLIVLKYQFAIVKSILISLGLSLLSIAFLSTFLLTFIIENQYLKLTIQALITFIFLFIIIYALSKANLKYSLLFSIGAAITSNILIYMFFIITKFFIHYENYYGLLAPIFLIILAIHLFIYLVFIFFIGAEEFTKISSIKFVKS